MPSSPFTITVEHQKILESEPRDDFFCQRPPVFRLDDKATTLRWKNMTVFASFLAAALGLITLSEAQKHTDVPFESWK